jgi:uncharacterized repeat protein (TIGR03843 family)
VPRHQRSRAAVTLTRDDDAVAARLRGAQMEVVGRFADASNATLLVRLRAPGQDWPNLILDAHGELDHQQVTADGFAVYKPQQGEAPLWDFPEGTLYRREVAAYEVARLIGWDLVPVTVIREDGPFGVGALQRYVPHDPADHYFTLLERGGPEVVAQLRRMVLFDVVIDNADRKGGHVLLEGERIRLVDHGVSFNAARKLRTVAWHFAGEPVPADDRADLARLADALASDAGDLLRSLLSEVEHHRLVERTEQAARFDTFPEPYGPRPYPWPLV